MSRYYNEAGQPITQAEGLELFGAFNNARVVASDKRDDVHVSTVHLVIDHSFGDGPPLIFETMIFGGEHDQYQERYSTREQAEEGHRRALTLAFGDAA